jgi:ACS family hexuronate transporter-like MFS transporter
MLGLGEAGIWPAASKVVSEWFPARERALAIGLYTLGATAGAALAPYIVIPLATQGLSWSASWLGQGWRLAFLITGLAGIVWVVPWLWLYRKPAESKRLTPEELSLISSGEDAGPLGKAWSLRQLLAFRPLWLLLAGRLITDPVWFFYQFWLAKYLASERGLDQKALTITWVVFAAAGFGSLAGGWFSGLLVHRGVPVLSARLRAMLFFACMMPLAAFTPQAGSITSVMILSACTVFAATAWLTNISAMVVDCMPRHSLGTAFSLVGAGSTLGGIAMNMMVAVMVAGPQPKPGGFLDQGFRTALGPLLGLVEGTGYGAWFVVMAFLHPFAFLLLWRGGIRRAEK